MPLSPIAGLQGPATALVTGASSGIGLAVVQQLLAHPQTARVYAVARRAGDCAALTSLASIHGPRLVLCAVDLTDESEIEALGKRICAETPELNLLFNCAGVLHAGHLRPEKSLAQVELSSLQRVFGLNAFAPILLAKALLPALDHGRPAVLASLSARVGSIGDNALGGWYAYRASKAAQNQLWRTLAVEMRRRNPVATCVVLHPGTVDTPLSEPFQANVASGNLFTAERAARQLLSIVSTLGPEDSGRFVAWDGCDIPW